MGEGPMAQWPCGYNWCNLANVNRNPIMVNMVPAQKTNIHLIRSARVSASWRPTRA